MREESSLFLTEPQAEPAASAAKGDAWIWGSHGTRNGRACTQEQVSNGTLEAQGKMQGEARGGARRSHRGGQSAEHPETLARGASWRDTCSVPEADKQ